MPFIIMEACEGTCDASCIHVCPVDCIYPPKGFKLESEEDKEKIRAAGEQLYINPDECIDCGACEPECPVEAILPEEEVPDDQKEYIRKNYERFGIEIPSQGNPPGDIIKIKTKFLVIMTQNEKH